MKKYAAFIFGALIAVLGPLLLIVGIWSPDADLMIDLLIHYILAVAINLFIAFVFAQMPVFPPFTWTTRDD